MKVSEALKCATDWYSSVDDTPLTQQAIDNMRETARKALPLAQAMEAVVEAMDTALELLTVPEHSQDDEWNEKYQKVIETYRHYESLSKEGRVNGED